MGACLEMAVPATHATDIRVGDDSGVGMAVFVAVANRKGGVGKSTLAVMLAHAYAVWGGKKVLVLDLDVQCNASLILIGGERWNEARKKDRTIGDYFYDKFEGANPDPKDYVMHEVGDVAGAGGKAPKLSLVPGSLLLEDVQGELFMKQSTATSDAENVGLQVRGRLQVMLKRFAGDFDIVIIDCPPGISFAALAALKLANKVLVPFRPDFVAQFGVDRVSLLIEERFTLDDLAEIPMSERRYVCVANLVRNNGRDRLVIDEVEAVHPMLDIRMPQRDDIAGALDWLGDRRSMTAKYGEAVSDVKRLYEEFSATLTR
jgi:chromosome partitioning protein